VQDGDATCIAVQESTRSVENSVERTLLPWKDFVAPGSNETNEENSLLQMIYICQLNLPVCVPPVSKQVSSHVRILQDKEAGMGWRMAEGVIAKREQMGLITGIGAIEGYVRLAHSPL
jgi:hypothetical protein